jgi:hypothetical protein
MIKSIQELRLDRTQMKVFSSFAEAEADDRAFWQAKTPEERLMWLELMRQSAYGYDDPDTPRLQRVLEFAQLPRRS